MAWGNPEGHDQTGSTHTFKRRIQSAKGTYLETRMHNLATEDRARELGCDRFNIKSLLYFLELWKVTQMPPVSRGVCTEMFDEDGAGFWVLFFFFVTDICVCLCVKFKSLKLILILILEFVWPLLVSIQQNQQSWERQKKDKCHSNSKTQPNKSLYSGYMKLLTCRANSLLLLAEYVNHVIPCKQD